MSDGKTTNVQEQLAIAELRAAESLRTPMLDEFEQVSAKAREEAQRRFVEAQAELSALLRGPQGPIFRRVLFKIIAIGNPLSTSFVRDREGRMDPISSAFMDGRKDVSLAIIELLQATDAGAYVQLLREHASNIESRKKEAEKNGRQRAS